MKEKIIFMMAAHKKERDHSAFNFVSVWRPGRGGAGAREVSQARKQNGGVVVRHVSRGRRDPVPRHYYTRVGHVTLVN